LIEGCSNPTPACPPAGHIVGRLAKGGQDGGGDRLDSHKSSLAVGVIDELGRVLAAREFANDERGHDSLLAWIDRHGMERSIGIEGSGSYGAGLARRLIERNEQVFEVPAFISHRERKKRPARGKSDIDDAIAIARVVARGEGFSSPAERRPRGPQAP
jgi:transposase